MCNCKSYNRDIGDKESIVVTHKFGDEEPKDICLDYCIADTIQTLRKNNIRTIGSCCGHNRMQPSVICSSIEDAVEAKKILHKIDDRNWEVSYRSRVVL